MQSRSRQSLHSSLLIILLVYVYLLVTGCGTTEPATPSTTTVTFMVFGDPHEQDAFQSVIERFQATSPVINTPDNTSANSPINIEMIALPSKSDYLTRLTTDFAAGSPPDVFLLNYRRMAQFHNRAALEPLGPLLNASNTLQEADYFPVALDAFRDSNGTLICIPQNISSQVVYYNRSLFDAAGHAYPSAGWTWAEFRAVAIALTQPDRDGDGEPDQYGLGLEPHLVRMAPFIWQNGGDIVDDHNQPNRLTLDTELAQEAMQFVFDLALEDGVVPNRTAEAVQSHRQRFYQGNIAMYIDSRRIVPTMRHAANFAWDVAPLPAGSETASILHSDGYCLASASAKKEAAWAFIEFAMSQEGQIPASLLGRTVPSLITVAESDVFLDPNQPPANAKVWLEAVPSLRVLPRLENWPQIERTAAIEFEQAYLGETDLPTVVERIQAAARDGFRRLE